MGLKELEKEYKSLVSHGQQFATELMRQLDELLKQQNTWLEAQAIGI